MRADGEFFPGKNFHVYGNSQLIDTRAIKSVLWYSVAHGVSTSTLLYKLFVIKKKLGISTRVPLAEVNMLKFLVKIMIVKLYTKMTEK